MKMKAAGIFSSVKNEATNQAYSDGSRDGAPSIVYSEMVHPGSFLPWRIRSLYLGAYLIRYVILIPWAVTACTPRRNIRI